MFPPHLVRPNGDDKDRRSDENPISEAMRMEARVMHKGIRLPESGPLTDHQREKIRKIVRDHAQANTITFKSIALQIGASSSTVSEVLKSSYRGDADKILRQLNSWVEDDASRRSRDQPIGFYETSVFKSMRDAARAVKRQADTEPNHSVGGDKARIAVAYGPSGCGKSEAAKAICLADPNAIYVRINSGTRSTKALARAIFDAAGWLRVRVNLSYMGIIFDKLQYSGRLLVIDEGHELTEQSLRLLRDLNDICKIPILICATEVFRQRVENTRRGIGNILDDQFSSRVFLQFDLLRGSDGKGGDKRPIFSLEEIAAIFNDDEVKLTDDGLDVLCAIACTIGFGMLRMAANIYEKARTAAKRRSHKSIDAALLFRACELVMLPPGVTFANGGHAIRQQLEASIDQVRRLKRAAG